MLKKKVICKKWSCEIIFNIKSIEKNLLYFKKNTPTNQKFLTPLLSAEDRKLHKILIKVQYKGEIELQFEAPFQVL